jgi:hypothetical protein
MNQLIKQKISFTVSLVVKYSEDPIFNILKMLLESYLSNQYSESFLSKLSYRLKYFLDRIPFEDEICIDEEKIKKFFDDLITLGCLSAFKIFFHSLNLSNALYYLNMELIEKIFANFKE